VLTSLVDSLRKGVQAIAATLEEAPTHSPIRLDRNSHHRIDEVIDQAYAERTESHEGDLREIDLDKQVFILRNASDVAEIPCAFGDDLLESAKGALDKRVRVTGVRRVEGGRRTFVPLQVNRLEVIEDEDGGEDDAGRPQS